MRVTMSIMKKINFTKFEDWKERWYKKRGYEFGSPILNIYRYEEYLVVVTRKNLYISDDGYFFEKVQGDSNGRSIDSKTPPQAS
jgi:phenylacetate-coenzyme A ligase PaaK-like adenylate-forming protein